MIPTENPQPEDSEQDVCIERFIEQGVHMEILLHEAEELEQWTREMIAQTEGKGGEDA